MKKTLIILPIMLGAILLGGCGNKNETPAEKSPVATENNAVSKVAGGLKEMLGMGKTMECTTVGDGVETKIYIQGQKYKSITTSAEVSMVGIFDTDAFYGWDTKTKAGTKMTMACMKDLEKNMPQAPAGTDEESFTSTDKLIEKEAANNNCQETGEVIDFSVPADINFVDQCALLKNMTQNLPKDINLPKDMPAQE